MRCANKAEADAAARVRAAGEQASQYSVAGGYLTAAAENQPATPIFAGARGHPRASSSPAGSTAGGSRMDHGPDIEWIYSGELDAPSDSKSSAKPDRSVAEADTAAPRGSLDKGLWYETFGHPTR